MAKQDSRVVVVGAGVIGCAVALALAREGRRVLLLDRAEPGTGGASFGNAGHIAAELVSPLPSVQLLFGFWRELFALGGPLHIPVRRLARFLPWAARFAHAAFRQEANTRHLAPLVGPAASIHHQWLLEIGRCDLLRRNGHYEIWLDDKGSASAAAHARAMARLGIPTQPAPAALLEAARDSAHAHRAAGLWFPESAHVVDPLGVVTAYCSAALRLGATFGKAEVRAVRRVGSRIEVVTDAGTMTPGAVVICGGAWSAALLAPLGLHVPLEAANGYHIELPGHAPLVDAPILYTNERLLVTPLQSRLRCSGYMEFSGRDAPQDPRKPARLRARLQKLGYRCDSDGPSWKGPRPVLPDYLPGIGRAPGGANVFYAIGHQHIGLTMAPITAELICDLVAEREPRLAVSAFDLRRFSRRPPGE